MANNIILFISLLSYSVIVSQSFMYILSLRNAQLGLSGSSYTELRHLIDRNMRARLKYAIYTALIATLLLVIINSKTPSGLQFITALIAFAGLVIDVTLTLKGNMPLNNIMNGWTPSNHPANWKEIRYQWLTIFGYRQIATIIGFLCLLIGVVFRER
jgi:hypothetical protein